MSSKITLRRLEADAARIAKRHTEIAQSQIVQAQAEQEYATSVEQFVLDTARTAGVMALPLRTIVAGLAALGNAGKSANEAVEDRHEGDGKPAEPVATAGGSRPIVPVEGTLVIVKVSRNVAEEKRAALQRAGLRWNGRAGHWRGSADAVTEKDLRAAFGDRVVTGSRPQSAGDGNPALDDRPPAATPEGEDLADASGLDFQTPTGTSGPTAAPPDKPAPGATDVPFGDAAGMGAAGEGAEQGPATWPSPLPPVRPARPLVRPPATGFRPR